MDYKPETSIIKKFKKKLKKEIFAVIKKEYLFKKFEKDVYKRQVYPKAINLGSIF